VLLTDGTVASLGLNSFGQLGNASDQATLKGVAVPGISNAVSVSSGNAFGIAVTADGTVWTWGDNVYGELGDGTTLATTVPEVIPGVSDVSTIVSGYGFSAALKTDGTAVAWGDNTLGQAGNGLRFAKQAAPAPVIGLAGMKAIAAGMTHALTLGSDGTIWSWGDNSMGELGRATTASGIAGANAGLIAGQKSDFVDGVAVAAGNGFSLALKSDGTVWTWGADITGQTGCTSFQPPCSVDPTVPRQVPMLNNIVQIAAGVDFALALKNDGTVYSFGSNTNGQLGSGVILQATQNLPARVKGLPAAAKIAAGGRHALAVLANGAVWSWGWNSFGQLGNGATTDNPLPALMNLTTPVSSAGAGYQFSYAAVQGGPLLAWGDNRLGEMGDGTYVMRARPVAVVHEGGTGNIATNDWFLIPDPTSPVVVAASLAPPILIQSRATGIQQALAVSTSVTFLSGDTGNSGVIHVTAKIPPNSLPVLAGFAMQDALRQATTVADPSTFVLVQLTPSGWQVVDNLQLIPLATGTLGSSIATQTIMAGIDVTQLAGAQFCIGYGASAGAMLANQTIRVAYAVAGGPAGVSCVPPSATVIPQNGVWWNPAEGGRGYTIEYNGTNLFMATYLYDATGRSTWYGAGPAPMSGSTFNAPLTSYYGGQTLTGNYQIATQGESPGNISITFTDPTHGTLTWPGGTIPIQRYEFVQNGLNLPPTASQPQTGWWWYPSEGGRGYSVEVQGNSAFIASYMYDANGNPVWYASGPAALVNDVYQGEWLSYVGGQTLTGSYQSPTGASAAGALTIQFSSPTTGLLSLPNGRVIPIQRFSF
jgi:alpha-tubulin suppressor-like RCC1 family protein